MPAFPKWIFIAGLVSTQHDGVGRVPLSYRGYGERLLAIVPVKKQMARFSRGGHVDLDRHDAAETAL